MSKRKTNYRQEVKKMRRIVDAFNKNQKKYYSYPDKEAFRKFDSMDLTEKINIMDAYNCYKKGRANKKQLALLEKKKSEIKNLRSIVAAHQKYMNYMYVMLLFMEGAGLLEAYDITMGFIDG